MNIRLKPKKPRTSHTIKVVSPTARPGESQALADRLIKAIK